MEHPDLREAIGWATEPRAQPHTVDTLVFSSAWLVRINETGVVYAMGNSADSMPVHVVVP